MTEVTVSLPDELLMEIDAEARRASSSRSAVLTSAAQRELTRRKLERRDPEAIGAAIARSIERFRDTEPLNATEFIRADRDRDERENW
jgi:metal-responsive CopG/Arc/MetJ family transcriptional regulator